MIGQQLNSLPTETGMGPGTLRHQKKTANRDRTEGIRQPAEAERGTETLTCQEKIASRDQRVGRQHADKGGVETGNVESSREDI